MELRAGLEPASTRFAGAAVAIPVTATGSNQVNRIQVNWIHEQEAQCDKYPAVRFLHLVSQSQRDLVPVSAKAPGGFLLSYGMSWS